MNYSDREKLDSYLQKLAISAQQNLPRSPERRIALTKLVNGIVRSGKLCYPQKGYISSGIYQDIYNEARQELLLYVCENIDKYNPERGSVITWVNVLLERRFFKNAIRKVLDQEGIMSNSMTEVENLVTSLEEPPSLTEIL